MSRKKMKVGEWVADHYGQRYGQIKEITPGKSILIDFGNIIQLKIKETEYFWVSDKQIWIPNAEVGDYNTKLFTLFDVGRVFDFQKSLSKHKLDLRDFYDLMSQWNAMPIEIKRILNAFCCPRHDILFREIKEGKIFNNAEVTENEK